MKLTLSLLAAVALAACASDKEIHAGEVSHNSDTDAPMKSMAPKAAKVSLAIEGMT